MALYRYRAATRTGVLRIDTIEAASQTDAIRQLRDFGLAPVDVTPGSSARKPSAGAASRVTVAKAIGELAVLLDAGLPLDRALAVCVDNIESDAERQVFEALNARVKEGMQLSRAMQEAPRSFPPMAAAMAAAGEANGALGAALARLAAGLERAEALNRMVRAAMVYPAMLIALAVAVVLAMLLWVVPQFENLFGDDLTQLPATTQVVVQASRLLRDQGLLLLLGLCGIVFAAVRLARRPSARASLHRLVLRVPLLGVIVKAVETARFARVLGSLIDGGVTLPVALQIAQRSLVNTHMATAIDTVAKGLREGAGLTGPLAATGVLPKLAISFLRTGEETARLGPMLDRLAEVLDRDASERVARLVAILVPAITVAMGVIVATVIASIMTAILSFNEIALTQ